MDCFSHDYSDVERMANILPLAKRRTYLDLSFLYKILDGPIDSLKLRKLIGLSAPGRLFRGRLDQTFAVATNKSVVGSYNVIDRIGSLANQFSCGLEFIGGTYGQFSDLPCLICMIIYV